MTYTRYYFYYYVGYHLVVVGNLSRFIETFTYQNGVEEMRYVAGDIGPGQMTLHHATATRILSQTEAQHGKTRTV